MNILDTEAVYVTCDNNVTMTNERGDTFEMELHDIDTYSKTVAKFTNGNYTSSLTMLGNPVSSDLKAGYYTGTATFRVSIGANQ